MNLKKLKKRINRFVIFYFIFASENQIPDPIKNIDDLLYRCAPLPPREIM